MDFATITETLKSAAAIAGTLSLLLIGWLLVARRWLPLRLVGILVFIASIATMPDEIPWWGAPIGVAIAIGASTVVSRAVRTFTLAEVKSAFALSSPDDLHALWDSTIAAGIPRQPVRAAAALLGFVEKAGVRRRHVFAAVLLLAPAVLLSAGFWTWLAGLGATVLIGGAFLMRGIAEPAGVPSTAEAIPDQGPAEPADAVPAESLAIPVDEASRRTHMY